MRQHIHDIERLTLVLYTDGLIESPGTGILPGMASLAGELSSLSTLAVRDACDALLAALIRWSRHKRARLILMVWPCISGSNRG